MNEFGGFLRELRGKRSLREMERLTGLSHTYLSSLEKGVDPRSGKERKPTPEVLRQIADAFPEADYFTLMKIAGYFTNDEIKNEYDEVSRDIQSKSQLLAIRYNQLKEAEEKEDQDYLQKINKSIDLIKEELLQLQNKQNVYAHQLYETSPERIKQYEEEEHEFTGYQNYLSGKSTAIYLDENNEGNFYFFNKEGRLPEEMQEKLRALIKLSLS